jgi:hypothetical protein
VFSFVNGKRDAFVMKVRDGKGHNNVIMSSKIEKDKDKGATMFCQLGILSISVLKLGEWS